MVFHSHPEVSGVSKGDEELSKIIGSKGVVEYKENRLKMIYMIRAGCGERYFWDEPDK